MKKVGLNKTSNFDAFIYLLIISNIIAMVLESHVNIKNKFGYHFYVFELISIILTLLFVFGEVGKGLVSP